MVCACSVNARFQLLTSCHLMQALLAHLSVNAYRQAAVYMITNLNPTIGEKVEEAYAFIAQ
jgi:hypothetical protein